MSFFQYLAAAVVAFSGLLAGIILCYSNLGELKPGRIYFIVAQKLIWAAIIVITAVSYSLHPIILVILFLLTIFPFFSKKPINTVPMYVLLGIIFYLSNIASSLLALNSGLIFLFGLPSGTLIKSDKKGRIKKGFLIEILKHAGFFICIILYLLF
jgi:hypothetical protein